MGGDPHYEDIFIYVPCSDEIVKISEGSGNNLDSDDIDEGYVDYIYYEQYSMDSFEESDGGMILRKQLIRDMYHDMSEAIPAVLDMAYGNANLEYVLLTPASYEEEQSLKAS